MKVKVILFKENDWWIGQCLEYDIAAHGKSIEDVQYEFQRICCGRIAMAKKLGIEDPFDIPKAPLIFFEMTNHLISHVISYDMDIEIVK